MVQVLIMKCINKRIHQKEEYKKQTRMKKTKILLVVFILLLTSCSKNDSVEVQNINPTENLVLKSVSSVNSDSIYGDFCFRGTHNSYSGGDRGSISEQLDSGMHFFELDLWPMNSDNVCSSEWSEKDRVLTSLKLDSINYIVNYSSENGQISIDKFHDSKLSNVFKAEWSEKSRVLTSMKLDGIPYLVNYCDENGKISIDKFNGSELSNVYKNEWSEKNRVLTSMELDGIPYLVNYCSENGQISIDKFNGSGLTNAYKSEWSEKDRVLATIVLDNVPYLFNYRKDSGIISINGFNGEDLYTVYKKEWSSKSRILTSISTSSNSYLVNYSPENGAISIDEFSHEFFLGHDYPSDEVSDLTDNSSSIRLKDWITFIKNNMPQDYPIFLMLEIKNYKSWLANDFWKNMLEMVTNTIGSENLVFVGSNAKKDGIDRSTNINDLKGKIVLYIEPDKNINDDDSTEAKELKKFRENRKYQSYNWEDFNYSDNKLDELNENIYNAANSNKIIRVYRLETDTKSFLSLSNDTLINFAISDDPYTTAYQYLSNTLNTVPK